MAIKQETIVLNDYGQSRINIRRRTSSRGTKDRVSIEIQAEPIVHVFDDTGMGADVAAAIRDRLEKAIKEITAVAKPSTIARRNYARREMAAGVQLKRYSGGRIGTKPPTTSIRLFNDSGRLSEGLHVRQNPREGNFTTNVPANRLTEDTQHLAKQLFELVPELKNPALLLRDKDVTRAIEKSVELMIVKAKDVRSAKLAALRRQRMLALKAAVGLVRAIAKL